MQQLEQLFSKKGDYLVLNEELKFRFKNETEAVKYLIEIIRFWEEKGEIFCNDVTRHGGEDTWWFNYKDPSKCSACVRSQKLLDKIFGSRHKFNELPFVKYNGNREYSFEFFLMNYFAKNGQDSTVRLVEERKLEKKRREAEDNAKKKQEFLKEQNAKLDKKLGETVISEELRQKILPYVGNMSLVIINQNSAVLLTSRSDWGSTGCVSYYSQVHVFYEKQAQMKEWQWRDRSGKENKKNEVDAIGAVELVEDDQSMTVKVELVNKKFGIRTVTYSFTSSNSSVDPSTVHVLTADEQVIFIARVEQEIDRVMTGLNGLWECKPKMVNPHPMLTGDGYVPYRQPSIKQRELHPEIGVAAFVTEEQIDHRVSDPQIRYALYVLTAESQKVERKAEDHGYDREGGAFLTILEIGTDQVVINTKNGKTTIALR